MLSTANLTKKMKAGYPALLLAAALTLAGQAAKADVCGTIAGNVVMNCGFESGSFSNWTLSGNLQGGAPPNSFYGVDNAFPNSGNSAAYFGVQGGGGSAVGSLGPFLALSQTLQLLPSEYYQISFYYDQNGPTAAPGYVNYLDLRFGGVTRAAGLDLPNSGGAYVPATLVAISSSDAAAAASTLLQFDFQNDADVFYFDDVSVVALGPVPEPASIGLVLTAGLSVMALALLRKR
jgi:hypothetical protein